MIMHVMIVLDVKPIQWTCLPLVENDDEGTFCYEIHVYTSGRPRAGTTSQVFFILFGDKGDTGIRRMDDGVRKVWECLLVKFVAPVIDWCMRKRKWHICCLLSELLAG